MIFILMSFEDILSALEVMNLLQVRVVSDCRGGFSYSYSSMFVIICVRTLVFVGLCMPYSEKRPPPFV